MNDGLSRLTFGRVARHLGVSDRVVVYYFENKDVLVSEVVSAMGVELQQRLAAAFEQPAEEHLALVRSAWPVLADSESDRVFGLFFEAHGLAAADLPPYASLVPTLVEAWIEWASAFVVGDDDHRRAEAEAAIALVDGLILLRLVAGPEAAGRAARRLGVA